MFLEGCAQFRIVPGLSIKRCKESLIVFGPEHCAVMQRDHVQRRFLGRRHGKDGIIHAGQRGGALDGGFDPGLDPKIHPFGAAFFGKIVLAGHRISPAQYCTSPGCT
jgi:hypothetical protein